MRITRKTWTVLLITLLSLFLAACSNKGEASSKEEAVQTITIEELQSNLEKEDWVVLDTRTNEAFMDPAIEGVEREGQIKGAIAFSVELVDSREDQMEALLKYKDITPDKNVVLYDANGKDAKAVAAFLAERDFKNLYLFDVKEWASNPDLPMDIDPNKCCPVSQ